MNIFSLEILNISIFENTILDYIVFLAVLFFLFSIIKIGESFALKRLEKRKEEMEEGSLISPLLKFILSIKTRFYLYLAFYLTLPLLNVPDSLVQFFTGILFLWIVFRLMIGVQMMVDWVLKRKILKDADPGTEVAAKNLGTIIKALLWIFAFLFVLANLGIEVTSLIAGLGVGGIAIGFAFQNILEDLFSSFAIYFDKPFTVGDFIIVGDQVGTVEKIGIKTTRVRALQGEEIVMSNKELTTEVVHNFKKLERRRSLFNFGVIYGTDDEKMRKIPEMVKEIIESKELAEFDRAHFIGFGDSALEFEVSYYVLSSTFIDFRNIHQEVLLDIKKRFREEEIGMAFPTRTVHLFKNN